MPAFSRRRRSVVLWVYVAAVMWLVCGVDMVNCFRLGRDFLRISFSCLSFGHFTVALGRSTCNGIGERYIQVVLTVLRAGFMFTSSSCPSSTDQTKASWPQFWSTCTLHTLVRPCFVQVSWESLTNALICRCGVAGPRPGLRLQVV